MTTTGDTAASMTAAPGMLGLRNRNRCQLYPTAISALRNADRIELHYTAGALFGAVHCTRHQPNGTAHRMLRIPCSVLFLVPALHQPCRVHATLTDTDTDWVWQTFTGTLRSGDELTFVFIPDALSTREMLRRGWHGDSGYAVVHRGDTHQYHYKLFEQLATGGPRLVTGLTQPALAALSAAQLL